MKDIHQLTIDSDDELVHLYSVDKHHIHKVSLPGVFFYVLRRGLNAQIFGDKRCIHEVSLPCVFFYVLPRGLNA